MTFNASIIRDLPFAEYQDIDAINISGLKPFLRSVAHGAYGLAKPKRATPAMEIGKAVHCLMLDGDAAFESTYAFGGPVNPKTGETYGRNSKAFQEWLDGQGGVQYLSPEELAQVLAIRKALEDHGFAAELIREAGSMRELTIVWDEPMPDAEPVRCKARIDFLHPSVGILDLKTCDDCRFAQFSKSLGNYDYHMQAAWYCLAARRAGLMDTDDYGWIAVESEAPHEVACWCVTDSMIDQGFAEAMQALHIYAGWLRAGKVLPPSADRFQPIDLPVYRRVDPSTLTQFAEVHR